MEKSQGMAKLARVVIPGLPHHVTQRGNRRQQVFFGDGDLGRRLQRHENTGRPMGERPFIERLSVAVGRDLLPKSGGRPKKLVTN